MEESLKIKNIKTVIKNLNFKIPVAIEFWVHYGANADLSVTVSVSFV